MRTPRTHSLSRIYAQRALRRPLAGRPGRTSRGSCVWSNEGESFGREALTDLEPPCVEQVQPLLTRTIPTERKEGAGRGVSLCMRDSLSASRSKTDTAAHKELDDIGVVEILEHVHLAARWQSIPRTSN